MYWYDPYRYKSHVIDTAVLPPCCDMPSLQEVHYNQHGLMMLEGQGIYRLANNWYPVQSGDAIWMAPFVPQWYAALGAKPTRYIIYKDTVVDPLL